MQINKVLVFNYSLLFKQTSKIIVINNKKNLNYDLYLVLRYLYLVIINPFNLMLFFFYAYKYKSHVQ
jgi:hypothetical protein